MPYTAEEKHAAIMRELRYRQHVYPRWIEHGKMSDEFATAQIAIFVEIAQDYQQQAEKERLL